MSVQAAFSDGPTVNEKIAALKRRVKALENTANVIDELDGADIAPGSIATGTLAAGSITADDIEAGSITANEIAAGTITANEIMAGSITTGVLAAGAITAETIAAGAITADAIAAGAITAGSIAADSITSAAIAAGSITATHIAAGVINASHIAAASIFAQHIQAGTITAEQIAAKTITADEISAGTITANEIEAQTITAGQIAAQTITANLIAANQITAQHIAASTIVASNIQAGAITTTLLAADAVTAANIAAGAIQAEHIAANSVNAAAIQANSITATQIRADALQTMWSTSAVINGGTIIGGSFITPNTTGNRIEIDATGIRGILGSSNSFELNLGTGIASLTGVVTLTPGSNVPGPALYGAQLGGGNLVPNSSFEQGSVPGDATDRRTEGYGSTGAVGSAAVVASNAFAFHGTSSAVLEALAGGSAQMYIGQRDIYSRTVGSTKIDIIPVQPNRKYTISAHVYTPVGTPARRMRLYYYFYDTNTGTITTVASQTGLNVLGTPVVGGWEYTVPGEWKRFIYTTPATPTNVKYMGFLAYIQPDSGTLPAGEKHYVDAFQVEQGDKETAYAPKPDEILYSSLRSEFIGAGEIKANNIDVGAIKAQHIGLSFGGNNRIPNSRGEYDPNVAGATNWTLFQTSASAISTQGVSKLAAFQVVSTVAAGSTAYLHRNNNHASATTGLTAGQWVTISGYAKAMAGANVPAYGWIEARWLGATATNSPNVPINTSTWTRIVYTVQVPVGATGLGYGFEFPTTAVGAGVYWTDLQLEIGEVASSYAPMPSEILPGTVGPTQITPNSITTNQLTTTNIDTLGIQANNIATSAITATKIAAGAITADKISVGASSDNMLVNGSFESNNGEATLPGAWFGGPGYPTEGGGLLYGVTNSINVADGAWELAVTAGNNSASSAAVPVVPGVTYRIKAVLIHDTASNVCFMRMNYASTKPALGYVSSVNRSGLFDLFGSSGGTVTGNSAQVPSGARTTYEYVWTVPAGVKWASVCFYNWTATGYLRVDAVSMSPLITGTQITPNSITTTHIATSSITADKLNFNPSSGANLLRNSAHRQGADEWLPYALGGTSVTLLGVTSGGPISSLDSLGVPINGPYLRFTTNGTGQTRSGAYQSITNIRGGAKYSISAYAWSPSSRPFTFWVDWRDTSGALTGTSTTRTFASTNGWARYSTDALGAFTAPPAAVSAVVHFWFENAINTETNRLANVQMEEGERTTAWRQFVDPTVIDGSTIQGATIRTAPVTADRVQITTTQGVEIFTGGTRTAQMKGGATGGSLDLTAPNVANYSTATSPSSNIDRKIRFLDGAGLLIGDISAAYGTYADAGSLNSRNVSVWARENTSTQTYTTLGTTTAAGVPQASLNFSTNSSARANDWIYFSLTGQPLLTMLEGDGESDVTQFGGSVARSGQISNQEPPNSVSGLPFTISRPGTYMFLISHTAYATTPASWETIEHSIDAGAFFGGNGGVQDMFLNAANVHTTFPLGVGMKYMTAGTHYWWSFTSAASNADDYGSLTYFKIGK